MKQRTARIPVLAFVAAILALTSASIAYGETVYTRIGDTPKVWSYLTAGPTATRVVAMWQKKQSDIDVTVYGDQPPPNGLIVGVGWGKEDRLETLEFAPPGAGAATFIVVDKAGGPATKVWFNVSTMGSETLAALGPPTAKQPQLVYLGRLNRLAAEDPFFEGLRRSLQAAKKTKARHR